MEGESALHIPQAPQGAGRAPVQSGEPRKRQPYSSRPPGHNSVSVPPAWQWLFQSLPFLPGRSGSARGSVWAPLPRTQATFLAPHAAAQRDQSQETQGVSWGVGGANSQTDFSLSHLPTKGRQMDKSMWLIHEGDNK